MGLASHFLFRHCLFVVFGVVFLDQMGLPLPAIPWLLAAGAGSAGAKWRLAVGLGATVFACVLADAFWFYLGRYRGNQVLRLLCRLSVEPDSCVRRARSVFHKYGLGSVVASKFLPGMSTVAPPLAGLSGMAAGRFLALDSLGSFLYGICFLSIGYFFSPQITRVSSTISRTESGIVILILAPTVGLLAYKYWQRRHLLRLLATQRITVSELRRKLEDGEQLLLLDVRSFDSLRQDPLLIQGARHSTIEDIESGRFIMPLDRDIIVYCCCPNEVSSAQIALRLQKQGFPRVRPLLGGIDAWRAHSYPMDPWPARSASF